MSNKQIQVSVTTNTDKPIKYAKIMIKFEGELFDFYDVTRVELLEEQDLESESGIKFGLLIKFKSYPFEKKSWYGTQVIRDKRKKGLETKLESARVLII